MNATPLSTLEILELKGLFRLKRRLVNPMRIDYTESSSFYRGETNTNGIRHGWGELLYTNGTVTAGKWIDGVMHGKGVYMSHEMTYKGDFCNNAFQGKGVQTYNDDGEHYIGVFVNGERAGFGKMTLPNGNYYIGYWTDSAFDGDGTLYANGTIYNGPGIDKCQTPKQ